MRDRFTQSGAEVLAGLIGVTRDIVPSVRTACQSTMLSECAVYLAYAHRFNTGCSAVGERNRTVVEGQHELNVSSFWTTTGPRP